MPYISRTIFGERSILKNSTQNKSSLRADSLKGKKVYVFSGIAGNKNFRQTVANYACTQTGFSEFVDHHFYTSKDIDNIFRAAIRSGADCLVTTEKDYVRMDSTVKWPMDLLVMNVSVLFQDGSSLFDGFIQNRLEELKAKK